MTERVAFLLLLALLAGGAARAECRHNGKTVEEGTRVGGLVCDEGRWVEDDD